MIQDMDPFERADHISKKLKIAATILFVLGSFGLIYGAWHPGTETSHSGRYIEYQTTGEVIEYTPAHWDHVLGIIPWYQVDQSIIEYQKHYETESTRAMFHTIKPHKPGDKVSISYITTGNGRPSGEDVVIGDNDADRVMILFIITVLFIISGAMCLGVSRSMPFVAWTKEIKKLK